MNISQTRGSTAMLIAAAVWTLLTASVTSAQESKPPSLGPLLWDTSTPLVAIPKPEERSDWKLVPEDLLLLEKEPAKASSDPGYYGREYSFKGDAVVETPTLVACFWSAKGCVTIFSKQGLPNMGSQGGQWKKTVDLFPVLSETGSVMITNTEVVRNAGDEVMLKISYSGPAHATAVFSFDRAGIIEVKPGANMKNVRLASSTAYGIVPGFIGDDLIFGGPEAPATNPIVVPAENMFVGLLNGEDSEFFLSWPKGKQRLGLRFSDQKQNLISSVDLDDDLQPFYLGALSAPGIWHKETLTADYLEKDITIQWKKPFPARWKTQLYEEELKTTFALRPTKGNVWRGVAGSYEYPVWCKGNDAVYHLGKKVQPKGESIIYFLEGQDTPASILTPSDFLKQSLGRQAAADILDFEGRKLRTHHRRGATGVRRACTCGCTEAIQAVFEVGEEVSQQDYIQGALDDMIYFVHRHMERIHEYQLFADGVLKKIETKRRSSPELKTFLDGMEEIARQIPQECEVQKENMKSFPYADELSKKTMALASKKDPKNLKAYMELLKAWRDMGGAQDYVVAKCHTITRSLCQAAGYNCGALPAAVPLAEEIRGQCRQALRNADGYEIWADY